jgi:hypothetical protein
MANKRISELQESEITRGMYTLGVNGDDEGAKIPIGDAINDLKEGKQDNPTTIEQEEYDDMVRLGTWNDFAEKHRTIYIYEEQ